MPTQVDIDKQRQRLARHRDTLAILLHQVATHTTAHAPPAQLSGIAEARAGIAQCKATLRGWGIAVADHPDDEVPAPPARDPAQAVADYLAAVHDYCASLPYLTLHDIRPPRTLDEIYVPLRARPQPRLDAPPADGDPRMRPESLSIADVLQTPDQPHVLILGEPGAGKSSLLRQLADRAWTAPQTIGLDAPHLPLLIPLRRLAGVAGTVEERLTRALLGELVLTQPFPPSFFAAWPTQTGARWLILLDAWDEVATDDRAHLLHWLKGLLKSVRHHRVVLTTRPSGYTPGELGDPALGHYDLLPFTPEQTGEFARRWCGDRAARFLSEFERVQASSLSGTPLLLTIAAKVFLERDALPARRVALYQQFVDIWLQEAQQRGLKADLGARVCKMVHFTLARLALVMTEHPGQVSEQLVHQAAANHLRAALQLSAEEADADGLQFVRVMARRSGVFIQQGDTYDFIHPTLREYLAATALVWACERDQEQIWQWGISRWRDEQWREVALYSLSLLSEQGQPVTPLLDRIWQTDADGVRFTAVALAEQIEVTDELQRQVVDQLCAQARTLSIWDVFWDATNPLALLSNLRDSPYAADGLLGLARNARLAARLRERVVNALARLGRAADLLGLARDPTVSESVREAVIDTLEPVERVALLLGLAGDATLAADVRVYAVDALERLGRTEEATASWLTLAGDVTAEPWRRERAVDALERLGRVEEAAAGWLTLAGDAALAEDVRVHATEALEKLGRVEEAAAAWLTLARDTTLAADVREAAVDALEQLGRTEEAAPILLELARDATVDAAVRVHATEALEKLGRVEEAAAGWLSLARDAAMDVHVRVHATKALARLGQLEEAAGWLTLADDATLAKDVRETAVAALELRGRIEEATTGWLTLACDPTVAEDVRVRAVDALERLGRTEEATTGWLTLAGDAALAEDVRVHATEALEKLGRIEEAAAAWLTLARDPTLAVWLRATAVDALVRLGRGEEAASSWLMLARDPTVDAAARVRAVDALGTFGRVEEAVPILLELARDATVAAEVRVRAAKALARLGRVEEAAISWLSLASDTTVEVWWRVDAAYALARLGRAEEAATNWLSLARDPTVDAAARVRAVDALAWLGRAEEATPILQALARDPTVDAAVRAATAEALARLKR